MRIIAILVVVVLGFESVLAAQEPALLVAPFSDVEAQETQTEWAEHLHTEVTIENSIGMRLTIVPPGEFLMGLDLPPREVLRNSRLHVDTSRELPQHWVRISRPYLVAVCEVTQLQYETVMGSNPSAYHEGGLWTERVEGWDTSQFPVEDLSWYDAIAFCNALSRMENLSAYYALDEPRYEEDDADRIVDAAVSELGGTGYRLLTEAEWEYACRAGTTTPFSFGESCSATEAHVIGSFPLNDNVQDVVLRRTMNTGSFAPNAFGLFDMHGNVAEYCWDSYVREAYADRAGVTEDPGMREPDHEPVVRGGSGFDAPSICRSASRDDMHHFGRLPDVGFRIARSLEAE